MSVAQQEAITRDSLQIARLEERMATMDRDMKAQTLQINEMSKQLALVLDTLTEARGGWRTLMWLGSAAAVAGGILTSIASWALNHLHLR